MAVNTLYGPETLSQFLSVDFDYIIVGGGTAGLLLAARLTENPNIQVGVIEAGTSKKNDPNVDDPARLARTLYNPEYDWLYKSIPQAGTNNKVHHVARGKLLGGSSGINYMAYCRPAAEDIDLWGKLGNKGWSWNELMPYYLKTQRLEMANSTQALQGQALCPSLPQSHGHRGPISTSYPRRRARFEDKIIRAFDETSNIPRPQDPWSGKPLGLYDHLSTINRDDGATRSYAASAFLYPYFERENLKVLTEATVCKVLLDKHSSKAKGAEFFCSGTMHQIFATMEIILSAGPVQSPRLLELSGIGNPELLRRANIDCILPLLEVGENLCEHPMTSITYALDETKSSKNNLHLSQAACDDGMSDGVSLMAFLPYSSLVSHKELEETALKVTQCTQLLEQERWSVVARLRDPMSGALQFNGTTAVIDIGVGHMNQSRLVSNTSAHEHTYYSFHVTVTSTLSRGSTHVTSPDPFGAPAIDLGLLRDPVDVELLSAGLEFADKVFSSSHVSEQVVTRVIPSPDVDLRDRQQASRFVRDWTTSFNHILGTCAMGRVVDERLRVKGISGLRVVDASVIPTQISGNVMATVYAVAEKAADLIKEDHGLSTTNC
ncbi:alcohol oxidase [Aspergillus caelatus]|uniref:Alcohol oxidase n=1 Tax=Aspergillus caelatus TaxID=61420 RepID=A0A5N7A875_9EURO|nr:alcohol oxidase [Aspergillus caelatus]KAE8365905.1 alcohol oxidase [Aspergillus caelatus]